MAGVPPPAPLGLDASLAAALAPMQNQVNAVQNQLNAMQNQLNAMQNQLAVLIGQLAVVNPGNIAAAAAQSIHVIETEPPGSTDTA